MAGSGTPASFEPCVREAGASGINVDGLPPLPDFDLIEQQTATLRTAGTTISSNVNAAAGNWRGLSWVYEAPEAPIVLSGFVPVLAHARQLETVLSSAITCLNDYAVRSRELKGKVQALRGQVNGLDGLIGGNDDWQGNLLIVDQRDDLFSAVTALAQEILTSDASCATALNAIHGAGAVTAPSIPVSDLNGSSDPISNALTNVLHFYGTDEELPDQLWGTATVPLRLGGPWAFFQGVSGSVLGAVDGTYTLLGTTDKVKQGQALQGIGTLAVAGLTTYAAFQRGLKDASKSDIDAVLTVGGVGKSVIHYDELGRNPAYAAGATTFDVASLIAPGGIGIGAKAGGVAGHAGVAGARTGHLLEEAGTAARWTGKLGELPAKASAAMTGVSVRAWENTIRPALDNLAGALNRLDEGTATVRVADGVAAGARGPHAGAADTLYRIVDHTEAPRHADNAPARHRAEGPADSATPVVKDSAPASPGSSDGAATPDPTNAPPSHAADDVADSGAAPSDQHIADTPTDLAVTDAARLAEAATKVEKLDATGIAYYAPDGRTIQTEDLIHPRAELEQFEYESQSSTLGLPADSPLVQRQLPEEFEIWDGKTREDYVELYANGTRPNGAPRIRSDAWPDDQLHPQGFLSPESRTPVVLQPGHLIDRYGAPFGNFTSPVGENFPDRALPDFSLEKFARRDGYHQYEVLHELPAWAGPAAPALGKAGGATQYYTQLRILDLLENGFIREVTP
ncbi:hypothetical protein DQ354_07965 [Arthrobacter sp. AQ5-06]|nr:hypothetical protein DQ354_07965 [Arthrobacter sp. AQ5-06]